MIIRGLACPYNSAAWVDDGAELVMDGAFAKMIADAVPVRLQFDTHDDDATILASTTAGSLSLFEDFATGLYFEAEVSDTERCVKNSMVLGKHQFASVRFTRRISGFAQHRGRRTRHIARAIIDHITICTDPAYRATAAWVADLQLDRAPSHIQSCAEQWDRAARAIEVHSANNRGREFAAYCKRADAIMTMHNRVQAAIQGRQHMPERDYQRLIGAWLAIGNTHG